MKPKIVEREEKKEEKQQVSIYTIIHMYIILIFWLPLWLWAINLWIIMGSQFFLGFFYPNTSPVAICTLPFVLVWFLMLFVFSVVAKAIEDYASKVGIKRNWIIYYAIPIGFSLLMDYWFKTPDFGILPIAAALIVREILDSLANRVMNKGPPKNQNSKTPQPRRTG